MNSTTKVARNFIRSRGRTAFRVMIALFQEGASGQHIGNKLGVSRERVRQWRDLFGQTVTLYEPYPETLFHLKNKPND